MTMRAIQIEVYFTRCMQQSAELLGCNTTGWLVGCVAQW